LDKNLQPMSCVMMINCWKKNVKLMQIIENICTKSLMHGWFCKEMYQKLIKKCVVRWPCCMCMLISFIPFDQHEISCGFVSMYLTFGFLILTSNWPNLTRVFFKKNKHVRCDLLFNVHVSTSMCTPIQWIQDWTLV